jgi:ankyrin repeat protein
VCVLAALLVVVHGGVCAVLWQSSRRQLAEREKVPPAKREGAAPEPPADAGPAGRDAGRDSEDVKSAIERGDTERVAALLRQRPGDARPPHKYLHEAARAGRTRIVQLLLEHGADPNLDYQFANVPGPFTPLSDAVTGGHFESARLLCERGARPEVSAGKNEDSLPHYAAAYLQPRFLRLLLEQRADPNKRDGFGLAPLHVAADRGDIAKARLLLDFKADVNAETPDGATPLFFGMVRGHRDFCDFLLAHGARLDAYSAFGLGLRREAIDLVAADPALANAPDRRLGRTPLFWAARAGDPGLVEWLLGHGARANVRAPGIVFSGNVVAGPRAWEGEPAGGRGVTPLHVAAEAESTDAVRLLLQKGAAIDARDDQGRIALHLAAKRRHAEILKLLVNAGADVGAQDDTGAIPLCNAIPDSACLEILLRAKADVNAADKGRGPPLLAAAYGGHKDVADLLLARGAKLEFYSACLLGRAREVEQCLKEDPRLADAPVPFSLYYDQTPLALAAHAGQAEVVDVLIARGAEAQPARKRYPSALHVAAMYGRQNVVEHLLAKGIPIDSPTAREAGTALFDAVIFAQPEMVRFLLERGANPRVRVSSFAPAQGTPLHCVGARRNAWGPEEDQASPDLARREVTIARLLIDAGADLEAKSDLGQTPLHEAASAGHAEWAALLLARGARVNARDKSYNTPLHYAEDGHVYDPKRERRTVAELLRKNGGSD